jgi:phosphatidylserine/phosphatidylglycerophosphate/cardiolipin synthase-like enzyme
LLLEKAKTVNIRLLVPTASQISSNVDSLKKLKQGGVIVRTLSSPYIHAKLILVDSGKAYVGSVNLSTQSMDKNRELGIVIQSSDAINNLFSTFQKDFDKGTDF